MRAAVAPKRASAFDEGSASNEDLPSSRDLFSSRDLLFEQLASGGERAGGAAHMRGIYFNEDLLLVMDLHLVKGLL